MIYIISGAPRIGKSVVAKELAGQLHADLISTDDLVDQVRKTYSEDQQKDAFPFLEFSGDPQENTLGVEERVRLQIISAQSMEAALEKIITERIKNNSDLVIEGVHLLPAFVKQLMIKYGQDKIIGLFAGSENVELILQGMAQNTNPNDWLKDADERVRRQVAEFVAGYSNYMKEEAGKESLRYLERSVDFLGDKEDMRDGLFTRRMDKSGNEIGRRINEEGMKSV